MYFLLVETRCSPKMFRMPDNRALRMFGKLTGGGQVQIELQRRRRASVQGTQDGQTPLDA